MTYENPILPGFYPDPSICRVGEDYYLVNSSFEFFPGVPLWHSRDLLHWEQLGYVLTRESQLPLVDCRTSGGIFAPTIRYHDGRFYMITTNVTGGGNFFVWTDDIRGEWSDPIWIDHQGIDPSLFWDADGKVYYTGTHTDENGNNCIGQFEIDLETGAKLSETKGIWYGTGGKCPEGPHMYRIGNWYYLMIAEGGTEYGHMETIARSRSVWGPFESCPHNPILTHRNAHRVEFQALGHADLVETPEGKWWMVFHGIRPSVFMLHHTGRETMIAPVTWDENGWPVVYGGKEIQPIMTAEGEGDVRVARSWHDDFNTAAPAPRWSYLRTPDRMKYTFDKSGVTLRGSEATLDELKTVTFFGVRQQQFGLNYTTEMTLSGDGKAGMTVFHTNEHHYELFAERKNGGMEVTLRRRVVDMLIESEPVFFPGTDTLTLCIKANRLRYTFLAGKAGEEMKEIGTGSTQLLSTECMNCTFTGCFVGLTAQGDCEAKYRYFDVSVPANE